MALALALFNAGMILVAMYFAYRTGCYRTRIAIWQAHRRHISEWGLAHDDRDFALLHRLDIETKRVIAGPWVKDLEPEGGK